jgi:hypothetical protein
MSKQSDAKALQNYIEKPVPKVCVNCFHYRSVVETGNGGEWSRDWTIEKNRRCALGGFAVKRTATCDSFAMGPGK